MERKLTKVVDGTEITVGGKMCSCGTDVANDLCSWECPDTYGSRRVAMQSRYLEIFDFTLFLDYFVFTPNAENVLEKELKREIPVSVGIERIVEDMSKMLNLWDKS